MSDLRGITRGRVWLLLPPLVIVVAVLVVFAIRQPATPARGGPGLAPTVEKLQPSALFVGDSYTAGSGAAGPATGEACLTAKALGWICNRDAQGGTGFVADGHANSPSFGPLASRLSSSHDMWLADIVIVDAGRNDAVEPAAALQTAIRTYLSGVRAAWPKARLVVVEPYYVAQPASMLSADTLAVLRAETTRVGGLLIDPIGEGWIKPSLTSSLTIKDGVHPNPAGHRYIADHLVADLRRLGLGHLAITDRRGAAARAG